MGSVREGDDLSLTPGWSPDGPGRRKKRRQSWQCEVCQRSFGRIEHLRRHVAGHQMERCHRCDHCKKAFSRSDTLRRHQLTHQAEGTLPKTRGTCACRMCASAKTRCSGDLPCQRCSVKGTECVYSVPKVTLTDTGNTEFPDELDSSIVEKDSSATTPDLTPQMASTCRTSELDTPDSWNVHNSAANWLFDTDSPALLPNFSTLHASIDNNTARLVQNMGTASPGGLGFSPERHIQDSILHCETTASGRYYIDGDAARLPRITAQTVTRRKSTSGVCLTSDGGRQRLSFPQANEAAGHYDSKIMFLSDDDYLIMTQRYALLCATPSPYNSAFQSSALPPQRTMNGFIQICLDSFQPLIPIFHTPSLDLSGQWLLSLSLAATGSSFAEPVDDGNYSYALNEFARRAISAHESLEASRLPEVTLTQIKLCNCIGLMYDGDPSSQKHARAQFNELAHSTRQNTAAEARVEVVGSSAHSEWQQWIRQETRWRTWYAVWLVDAMWTYQFRTPPLLRLEHANFPLPCQEVLWEAESAMQWQHVFEYSPQSPTLIDAIHSIYVHKRLQPTMGEFSRIILIHGLYHRNWEVGDYLRQPLSAWLPSASRPGPESVPKLQVWLPQDPIFSRWRNASCDSLDILHWSANSVIGAASGLEHPKILHLHLARVILLTPVSDIRRLALIITEGAQGTTEAKFDEQQQKVRKWAIEDAYKARLAMIHAGALLWHVRRYSAKAFHEGSAVFMATLALWAYGRFGMITPEARSNEICNDEDEDHSEEDPCPITINLDRPADDELVQTFIKKGHSMQALLNGVGEIRSPQGPKRVLREGLKIITRSRRWASNCSLVFLMERLAKLEPQHVLRKVT